MKTMQFMEVFINRYPMGIWENGNVNGLDRANVVEITTARYCVNCKENSLYSKRRG